MRAPRLKSAAAAAILCILIAAIGGTSTFAARSDGDSSDADRAANSPELRAALRDELARLAREDARRNTDEARRQRRASRTAYRDLAASEAVALLREDAPELLTSLDRDLELRPGERVLAARDDRTRLIDRPEGPHALAESSNPTTATDDDGEKKPIDLTLERKGNAFVPANAAADIAIDEDLSGGVSLAQAGVTVRPSFSRPAAAAQVVAGEKVFFPNSDRDTDLLIAPLPEGFETYSYLRSEDSPERHRLEFDLPRGAELRPLTLGDMAKAGAEVVRDGRRLATVAPPQAWDADRQLVPVRYEVAGASIRIEVDHREGDFRYPITLDPTVTDWYVFHQNAYDQNPNYWGGWFYQESPYQSWNPNYNPFYPLRASLWGHGLNIFLNAGTAPGTDWWGEWALDARPNTAIVGADFYRVNQQPAGTCIRFYTWSSSLGVRSWNQSCNTPYTNSEWHTWAPEAAPHGNRLAFNYISNHDQPRTASSLSYVGEVWVHETDYEAPWFENWYGGPPVVHERRPEGWTARAPDIVARPHLRDRGLGVYDSWIAYPAREGGTREVHDNWDSCTGNRASPCPYNYAWNIPYSTDDMPEGINTVTAFGRDAVSNDVRGESWPIKVDRTGPQLRSSATLPDGVGGTLWNGRDKYLGGDSYTVDVLAGDSHSGVDGVELKINGTVVDSVGGCGSDGCGISPETSRPLRWSPAETDAAGNQRWRDGAYTVTVEAWDRAAPSPNRRELKQWQVNVDRTQPDFEIFGSLPLALGRTLREPRYDVAVDATDESAEGLRAGVESILIRVNGEVKHRADQTCPATTGSCPLSTDWNFEAADYAPGQYTISVEVRDRAGNADGDEWLVFVPGPTVPEPPDIRPVNTEGLLRIDGAGADDAAGTSVAGVGDVNGDGTTDYAVGAPGADSHGRSDAGTVYVIYGRQEGPAVDLASFSSIDGFRIDGATANDRLGTAVTTVKDMNGDGLTDFVVGAPRLDVTSGAVWVVFGSASPVDVDLAELGFSGFRIDGPPELPPIVSLPGKAPPQFGAVLGGGPGAVNEAGNAFDRVDDINGDGRSDLVLGAASLGGPTLTPGGNDRLQSGSAFVVYGKSDSGALAADDLGAAGFRIDGAALGDLAGSSVANLGDVNGDGLGDVGVGAPGHEADGRVNSGAAYMVFGAPQSQRVDLAALGARGFRVKGLVGDLLGLSITAMGDLNRDERQDFAVAGKSAFLGFGRGESTDLDAVGEPSRGLRITGIDGSDLVVGEAGDNDQDGSPDLLVGAPGAAGGGAAGLIYTSDVGGDRELIGLGGHHGFRVTAEAGQQALGQAVAAGGRASGINASDQLAGAPGSSQNGRSGSGSVYVLPGDFRASCGEGYQAQPSEVGQLATCLEGSDALSLDMNNDGEFETTRAFDSDTPEGSRGPEGQAAGSRRKSATRKSRAQDTGTLGELDRYGNWRIRRTGLIIELGNRPSNNRIIGRAGLFQRLRLSGDRAFHAGTGIPRDSPVTIKPRVFLACEDARQTSKPCRLGGDVVMSPVYHSADDYSRDGGGYCYGLGGFRCSAREAERNHREIGGRYRWRINWTGLFKYRGVENVEWGRRPGGKPFFTRAYRCGNSCYFFRRRR